MTRPKKDDAKKHVHLTLSVPPLDFDSIESDRNDLNMSRSHFFIMIYRDWKFQQWAKEIEQSTKKAKKQ